MFKKFDSYAEMKRYEAEKFKFLHKHSGILYAILDIIVPKYRRLRKEYTNFFEGWYRDAQGRPCAYLVSFIDSAELDQGEVCLEITPDGRILNVYKFLGNCFLRISGDMKFVDIPTRIDDDYQEIFKIINERI